MIILRGDLEGESIRLAQSREDLIMRFAGTTLYQVDVCDDCAHVLANGANSPETERAAFGLSETWPENDLVLGCPIGCCPEEAEPWFSWQPCEGCNSPEGGNRQHATWLPAGTYATEETAA